MILTSVLRILSALHYQALNLRFLLFFLLATYLPSLFAIESRLQLNSEVLNFNYAEFNDNGALLDEENGLLPGISLQLSLSKPSHRLLARLQYFDGEVDYDGQTQDGDPFRTNTSEALYSLSVKQFFSDSNDARLEWLLGIELWFWQRDILSRADVQGLFEKYQWQEFSAGVSMQVLRQKNQHAWLEAQLLQTISPRMSIQLDNGFGTVRLGTGLGYRLRFIYQHTLTPQWHWQAQAFIQYFEFGKSNRIAVEGFFGQSALLIEPRSVTRHQGFSFGLQYDFEL